MSRVVVYSCLRISGSYRQHNAITLSTQRTVCTFAPYSILNKDVARHRCNGTMRCAIWQFTIHPIEEQRCTESGFLSACVIRADRIYIHIPDGIRARKKSDTRIRNQTSWFARVTSSWHSAILYTS